MPEKFICLSCQSCGAKLEVYDDMNRFACGYCGSEMIVQRRGGTIALKAIEAAIEKVQVGTGKTAAELALLRLKEEPERILEYHRSERDAVENNYTPLETSPLETGGFILMGFGAILLLGVVVGTGSEALTSGIIGSIIVVVGIYSAIKGGLGRKEADRIRLEKKKIELDKLEKETTDKLDEIALKIKKNTEIVNS